ncbi:MAG TPA: hypothetical protein VF665_06110 [Longimicrobium sp.]|jgi:hypothetical protein|uniref:DUF6916 family protein n=1 Tax=Longimicrobium sp. TaxID=2029185 RepID=UPI002EDB4E63
MLDTLTIESFQPHVGQIFTFVVGDERLPTKLTEVHRWGEGAAANRPRHPFSLIFHTVPQAIVPQAMYRVESEVMEPMELFLVPIEPDARGMRYEAVFT